MQFQKKLPHYHKFKQGCQIALVASGHVQHNLRPNGLKKAKFSTMIIADCGLLDVYGTNLSIYLFIMKFVLKVQYKNTM